MTVHTHLLAESKCAGGLWVVTARDDLHSDVDDLGRPQRKEVRSAKPPRSLNDAP